MFQRCVMLLVSLLLLVACAGGGAPTESPAASGNGLTPVTAAFSYIPNVQFAPFYVADSKGYYAEAGLEVAFDYNFETDVMPRVAQGNVDFAHGSGLSVLLARQQNLPVAMVMTHYQQFPVVFFSKAANNIETVEDMHGKSMGIPGRYGANYYALQALLYASGMTEADLDIQEIGFTQIEAILADNVEIATGYAMNEPVQLRQLGEEINVIRVADIYPVAGDGIITNETMIETQPELVRAFVQATLRGLQDTLENPDEAFEICLQPAYIPEASLGDPELQRQVLVESLPYWEATQLGYTNPAVWEQSHTFLRDIELLTEDVPVNDAFTNAFIEE